MGEGKELSLKHVVNHSGKNRLIKSTYNKNGFTQRHEVQFSTDKIYILWNIDFMWFKSTNI